MNPIKLIPTQAKKFVSLTHTPHWKLQQCSGRFSYSPKTELSFLQMSGVGYKVSGSLIQAFTSLFTNAMASVTY